MNNDPVQPTQPTPPEAPRPTFTPPQAPTQQHQNNHQPAINPGQTLGTVGIVMNFLLIHIAGIILGVLSRNQSKQANMPTALGTVSLVWGIVGVVSSVLITAAFVFLYTQSYNYSQQMNDRMLREMEMQLEMEQDSDYYDDSYFYDDPYTYPNSIEESI